jgi:tetratricopeptide (TPR) repeat protein
MHVCLPPALFLALLPAAVIHSQTDPLLEALDLYAQGRYLAAEELLVKMPAVKANDPRAKAVLALARASTGRCAEAANDLQSSFETLDNADLRRLTGLGLARCHIAAEKFAAAFPVLYRLKELYPDDADVLYEAARMQMKAWNEVVREMFEKTPASFRVNQLSAEIFEIQAKYSEAVTEYRKAIEKSPRTLNLHYRLGRALLMESHEPAALEAALREFEAELSLNPNDAVAHYQVAQILQAQQKRDEALARLGRAVQLDPNFAEAVIALGRLHLDASRTEQAITLLERAVRLVPQSESAHYALMIAYRNAGRRDDAQRQKQQLDELQKSPEGEFTEFLKRIGEQPKQP